MIISASRRTDIPALYGRWFANRLRAGFCTVPNPFNPNQVSTISLARLDVNAFVFWTKNPAPFRNHLPAIEDHGAPFYLQFTLNAYPKEVEPGLPGPDRLVASFLEFARLIGPERMVWRYDPILFGPGLDATWHIKNFTRLAEAMAGSFRKCVVSLFDQYAKVRKKTVEFHGDRDSDQARLVLSAIGTTAARLGFPVFSCAEARDFAEYGIRPGKCIDDDLLRDVFGLEGPFARDTGQREHCGCVKSRDIGMYDTCTAGCVYCYANAGAARARANAGAHDPESPSLAGRHEPVQDDQPSLL